MRELKENDAKSKEISAKKDLEMKKLVKTLRFYSEEKTRLEKELDSALRENDSLIGHKNPSQKI